MTAIGAADAIEPNNARPPRAVNALGPPDRTGCLKYLNVGRK
jgi:hypothetical protein